MPPRFFCSSLPAASLSEAADSPERFCTLGPDETKHARKVLRLPVGASIEVFDGSGRLAEAEVVAYERDGGGLTQCRLGGVREVPEVFPRLTVATAIPKGPRAEAMVNQLGQLGADVLVPVQSERSVVEPGAGKVERYEKAALASAKQSGRPRLMAVEPMATLGEVLARPSDVKLILDPRGQPMPGLSDQLQTAKDVLVLVGPEGGWSEGELAEAQSAGCVRWRMAEHVLRIETAATAAVSILRYLTA
ncbi:RsmE family RNA methyltransferase [Algisphaera agarilytica]|uniref:Ribosomal RNA small subunit methyltransferase E n=1 Tax=Algisphaera agarilytica TaxID=1385975 RepID=A0A7X0H4Y8_9BACT|nr:RsmE family RNA methyltransferase [Algisphaera agarilytica]MBB6429334.1 16S rRNA (uracil1498-N3)-methyltransferase [Algisphaera agarilytica]